MKNLGFMLIPVIAVILISCKKESADGTNSLIDIIEEPAGENCLNGGFKIMIGLDLNNNNILDSEEIQYNEYICDGENGSNGLNSLIITSEESPGVYCSNGGIRIETGLDINSNGLLEDDEIQTINYVCNGEDGQNDGSIDIVRYPFTLAYTWRDAKSSWSSEVEDGLLYNFNICNYQNFDSIIFVSQFFRQPYYTTDKLWLRLYDYTAGTGINGSELYSEISNQQITNPDSLIFKSGNFYNSILQGERTIGIQFRKEVSESRGISIHHAEIVLYKQIN